MGTMNVKEMKIKLAEGLLEMFEALEHQQPQRFEEGQRKLAEVSSQISSFQLPLLNYADDPWQVFMGCFYRNLGTLLLQQARERDKSAELATVEAMLAEFFKNVMHVVAVQVEDHGSGKTE